MKNLTPDAGKCNSTAGRWERQEWKNSESKSFQYIVPHMLKEQVYRITKKGHFERAFGGSVKQREMHKQRPK